MVRGIIAALSPARVLIDGGFILPQHIFRNLPSEKIDHEDECIELCTIFAFIL